MTDTQSARRRLPAMLAALATAFWMNAAAAQSSSTVSLGAGKHRIEAEVADDDAGRQLGLMYRSSLPEDRGMVFVYSSAIRICMWMKNTLIPLSVAFLDEEGRILNIEDMLPQTEDNHCAIRPARYALEMNRGWFARHGVRAGDRIEGAKLLGGR